MQSRFLSAALSAAALVAGTLPASALEPDAVAKALGAALIKGSNVDATYDAARAEGSDVVVEGLTVSRRAGDQTIRFETVAVTSPTEGGGGIFGSPQISFSGGTLSGEASGTIATVALTDAVVLDPTLAADDPFGAAILFSTAEVTGVHATREGEPGELSIERIAVEAGNVVGNVAQDSKGRVENLTLSPDLFPAGAVTPTTMGYEKVALDLSWDSTRDLAGTMTIRNFTILVADGGELSVEGVIGNLPDPRVLNDAGGVRKASKAVVHQLTLRYHDNSLAGRVLDALAKRQGLTRDEYIQQLTAALPFLLLTLNNPAFQAQATAAIKGFLENPQSLTITLEPDAPVSGSDILSLLKSSPAKVTERLKASVTANEAE
jgi:hypothetical protein